MRNYNTNPLLCPIQEIPRHVVENAFPHIFKFTETHYFGVIGMTNSYFIFNPENNLHYILVVIDGFDGRKCCSLTPIVQFFPTVFQHPGYAKYLNASPSDDFSERHTLAFSYAWALKVVDFYSQPPIMAQGAYIEDFSETQPQIVVSQNIFDAYLYKQTMISQFKSDPSIFEKLVEAQGAGLSINHHIPVVEDFMSNFKTGMNDFSKSKTLETFISYVKHFFGICSSYKFWLSLFLILQVYAMCSPNSNISSLRTLKYFTLSLMMLTMLINEISENEDIQEDLTEAKEHFWQNLAPLWKQMQEEAIEEPQIEMQEVFVPQGLSDFVPGATTFLLAGFSILTGYGVREKLISSIIVMSKATPMQYTNITSAIVFGFNSLSKVFKSLDCDTLSEYFHIDVCSTAAIQNFCNKCRSLITRVNAGEVYGMAYYAEVYNELLAEGNGLLKIADKHSYDYRLLSDLMKQLRSCQEKLDTVSKSLKGVRVEPVGIMLHGVPGCAKSVLMNRLAHVVAEYTIPEEWAEDFDENPNQFIYAKPIDKFFDGYTNKAFVVLLDDFGQARDGPGEPDSEAMNVIRMINSAEYPLPMANVDSKNNVYFRSPFVLLTSNLPDLRQISSINDTGALQRRFNFDISVSVAPQYLDDNGKLETKRLPLMALNDEFGIDESSSNTYIPSDFWKLTVTRRNANNVSETTDITFEQLVKEIIKSHYDKIKNFHINRMSEKLAMEQIRNSLSDTFPQRKNFQKAYFSTYRPQSGLPGKWEPDENTEVLRAYWDYSTKIHNMFYKTWSREQQDKFMLLYYHLCENFSFSSDVFSTGFEGVCRHLIWLAPDEIQHLYEKMENSVEDFVHTINISYNVRWNKDLHPWNNASLGRKSSASRQEVMESVINSVTDVCEFVEKHKMILLLLSGTIIVSAFWATGLINSFLPNAKVVSQSFDTARDRKTVGKPTKTLAKGAHKISVRPQAPKVTKAFVPSDFTTSGKMYTGFMKPDGHDVLEKVLKKYLFIMYLVRQKPDGELDVIRMGHVTNVRGRVFLMPMHFAYQLDDVHKRDSYLGANIVLTTVNRSTTYSCSLEDLMHTFAWSECSAEKDFALFEVTSAHATSTGALNYFMNQGDLDRMSRLSSFDSCLVGTYRTAEGVQHVRTEKIKSSFLNEVVVNSNWETNDEIPNYMVQNVVNYSGSLFAGGDCGAINTILSHSFENRCIIGIHIAGDDKQGFSNIITQEHLKALLDESFPNVTVFQEEEKPSYIKPTEVEAQGLMLPVATLTPEFTPGSITKSEIIRSKFFGRLPEPFTKVVEFPAKLAPFRNDQGDLIDPLVESLKKYAKPEPIHFREGLVKRAVSSYGAKIFQNMTLDPSRRTKVPIEEALHAFSNVRGISSSTSPGFPMCLPRQENVKKTYYNAVQNCDTVSISLSLERIATLVQDVEEKWSEGIRPAVFYKGCNKDETRPIEKVKSGSTRMFSAGDFIYLLMYRMYFGAFMSSFFEANINVGSGIGVNPYSRTWDSMIRKMSRFDVTNQSRRFGAGDYSKFDTCERPEILWEILLLINKWYGEGHPDNDKRKKLWAEIINSKHVIRGEVYEWQTGMPSGNPLTSVINTMYNHIVFRMAYQLAGYPAESFNRNVELMALGDDNIFSVSDLVKDDFNEITLVELMSKCGMVYTTELKKEATIPLRLVTEISFLKRSNRFDKVLGRWVAPIALGSIFTSLNWTTKGIKADQILADKLPSALGELSLHGRPVFDTYAHKLMDLKARFLPDQVPSKEIFADFDVVYCDMLNTEFYL